MPSGKELSPGLGQGKYKLNEEHVLSQKIRKHFKKEKIGSYQNATEANFRELPMANAGMIEQ